MQASWRQDNIFGVGRGDLCIGFLWSCSSDSESQLDIEIFRSEAARFLMNTRCKHHLRWKARAGETREENYRGVWWSASWFSCGGWRSTKRHLIYKDTGVSVWTDPNQVRMGHIWVCCIVCTEVPGVLRTSHKRKTQIRSWLKLCFRFVSFLDDIIISTSSNKLHLVHSTFDHIPSKVLVKMVS